MAQQRPYDQSMKGVSVGDRGPSTSKVIAAVTMLPVGGTLLFISGLILTGTVFLLAISTPVFILFSPVLVPAGLVIGLAVTGFLTAGGFGITALSSVSWMANYLRQMTGTWPRQLMRVRGASQETQKTREAGQIISSKSPETTSGKT